MSREMYYGVIGNGETCALVSPRASIEWLCLPKFDGKIVYSKALDNQNGKALYVKFLEGSKELKILDVDHEYIEKTNILVTTLNFKNIKAKIYDFMPRQEKIIFRLIKLESKSKKRKIKIEIQSTLTDSDNISLESGMFFSKDNTFLGLHMYDGKNVTLEKGKSKTVSLAILYETESKKLSNLLRRVKSMDPEKEFNIESAYWNNWLDRGVKFKFFNKKYEEVFYRALLTMKLMQYKNGSTVAAPTASFPATQGKLENWDYRFAWIRDNYFVARAFLISGHYKEVKQILSFFYKIQQKNGHWKSPLYTIEGKKLKEEIILKNLKGQHGEDHIRINNEAKNQLQLDNEGSILHATYLYFMYSKDSYFVKKHWNKIKTAANWIVKNHNQEEHGIWEFRHKKAHYTYGKVMCFVGLDSAVKIGNILGKDISTWKKEKEKLKKEILKNAWSKQRKAFLQTYEKDAPIDISVLSLVDFGIISPKDKRTKNTVKLIEEKLVENFTVKRYENAHLPFYLPTLWLASYYIKAKNLKKAAPFINKSIDSITTLNLPSEHFDPISGKQHGNFPQTFCSSMFAEQLFNYNKKGRTTSRFLSIYNSNLKDIKNAFFMDRDALLEAANNV
ncbi:glycoside hydrolase family 15 protein [Candidatus Aenigmatarchaeota archaeon]